MKAVFKIILVCALAFFCPAVFADDVLTHSGAQIQITVPAN